MTAEASDTVGNVGTCTFTATVTDTTPPVIACVGDKTVSTDPGSCSAVVTGIAPVSATDNCGVQSVTWSAPGATPASGTADASGTTFPKGTTTVTYTITDTASLTAQCSFNVTVNDTEAPIFAVGGAVDWYRAEGNADDSIGGHNGAVFGGVTYVPGHAGQAFSFDGSSGYVDLGPWFGYQTFSISLWVNPAATQVQYADILDNNHTASQNWVMQQDGTGDSTAYYWYNSNGLFTRFHLTPNTWNHIVVTRSIGNLNIVYVNGVEAARSQSPGPINYTVQDLKFAHWGNGDRFFTGLEDEIMVFNRDLTPTEVQSLYSGTGCPADITVNNDPGQCGAVVNYVAPVGTDNCPGATTTQIAGLPSGSLFPVGTTVNTFQVTDTATPPNVTTCSFNVTVNDTDTR